MIIKRFVLPLVFLWSFTAMAASPASTPAPAPKPAIAASAPAAHAPTGTVTEKPTVAPVSAPAAAPVEPASSTVAHVDLEQPTVTEVVKTAEEVVKSTKEYMAGKDDANTGAKKALALFGIISLVLKLLLSLLKVVAPFFSTNPKASLIIRAGCLVIGVIVFFFSQMSLGMPWWDSLLAGLSGPGAILWHEYSKMLPWFGKKEEKK